MTRTLSICSTINIERYENIRVELTDEVRNQEEEDQLVASLDRILSTIGRNDEAATRCIDSYRRRVLSQPSPQEKTSTTPETEPEKKPAPPEPQKKEEKKPAKSSAPDNICADCGAKIDAAMAKKTALFAGRALCDDCLKEESGGKK